MIPFVIANGEYVSFKYGDRAYYVYGPWRAVIRKTWDGKKKTWLVTNFEDDKLKDSHVADAFARSATTASGTNSPLEGSLSNKIITSPNVDDKKGRRLYVSTSSR